MSDATLNSTGRHLASRSGSLTLSGYFSRITNWALGLPRAILNILIHWQRRAEDKDRIRKLDDRLLRDVGLTRYDLKEELEKPFWSA
ncbi:MAG: hypothetical protein HQ512_04140 [Rhodospirillales bacterium]|nr:hypothetical protein [Rhodospirillales bacterium]